ncbi:MAG: tRNA (adenine-N1)-methyltransferase [Anaerolineae bacterium]|nr:tRNA (adenine-N1)-methyltransferase [Anaerolineae bacterium]MDW7991495.1 tRNA (adenine-N1)-methyltransferase [Anaerolineae bacterium]
MEREGAFVEESELLKYGNAGGFARDLACAQAGDLALLVGPDRRWQILRLEPGQTAQTHRGVLAHDDLIGRPWGSTVLSHMGQPFLLLRPSLHDLILRLRRTTQIVYPKEAGYILLKMNIGPGCRVVEAGTGSGALTAVLAHAVRPNGRVYSYEIRPEMQHLARRNLERLGLADVVEFKERDIAQGFDETGVDAVFLDLPNPWDYLEQAYAALVNGGYLGSLLPTANQVTRLLAALESPKWGLVEVEEILLRPYKAVSARFRPEDRMVAHTGFLIFARALVE